MLRSAYQGFLGVGMTVRTDRLAHAHPWLLSRDLVQDEATGIDPVSAHQLVRTLSAARTPDGLASLALGTVADMTGASRIIALTGEADRLGVRAVHEHGVTAAVDGPWTEVPYDEEIIVRQVLATGAPVRVTGRSGTGDPVDPRRADYLAGQHDRCDLCRAGRSGAHASPPSTRRRSSFLCAQCAAPLWNFQLEARLRAADEHRQSLIDVQSRFVPNELLRILDIDDLRRVRSGHRVEREMTVLISDIRGLHDAARGHGRRRGEQSRDRLLPGRGAADHRLQRGDPGCARGRDRRRLRIGARQRRAGRTRHAALACASTTGNGRRTAPTSSGWASASIPVSSGWGSSAG